MWPKKATCFIQNSQLLSSVFKKSVEGGKPDLTDSAVAKFEKISEIQENSAEMHRRRCRNSENREDRNVASFTEKSPVLLKNRRDDFWANFAKNQVNFAENR
jgi:hypothetical protein